MIIIFALLITLSMGIVYAAQSISDRTVIDDDDDNLSLLAGDLFGYEIEAIGDLNNDGVIDLATIKFSDDSGETNAGSILILFMNDDGSVSSTNEIIMDASASGIGSSCIVGDGTNRDPFSLEQLAFVGDLDGDGEPTLALGAPGNDHDGIADSGAVYMLELNSDGTVDNCLRIIPGENGFAPADEHYLEAADAFFGWPLIATDLNGDGQNELIVGAGEDDFPVGGATTNLWVFFLTSTGAVSSHPATPIFGITDIEITPDAVDRDYISDGDTIDGGTKIVIGVDSGDITQSVETGAIHIINLSSAGAFLSSTRIDGDTLGQGITGNGEKFGRGVAAIGDMNADGINDIMVGNRAGDDTNANSGEVYILYMNSDDTVKESQKISNESENTRGAGTPFAGSDLFGNGMALWRNSGSTAIIAIGAHEDDTGGADAGAIYLFSITRASTTTDKPSGGSGDQAHKTRPSFGMDHNRLIPIVDDGLIINGKSFQVRDNWWTAIPIQNMTVGVLQNFTATTYAAYNVRVMEFLFGVPEVGSWNEAEASIALFVNFDGEIYDIKTKNTDSIINLVSLECSSSNVNCQPDDEDKGCQRFSIEFSFNESPTSKIFAFQAIDFRNRPHVTYFNDGIDVTGESLNPPVQMNILSPLKHKGLQTVERIDKVNDIWITLDTDERVEKYQQNEFGTFLPIEWRTIEHTPDEIDRVMQREHSEFANLIQLERNRATEIFDSSLIQGVFVGTFAYEFPDAPIRSDKNADILKSEELRATKILDMRYPDVNRQSNIN